MKNKLSYILVASMALFNLGCKERNSQNLLPALEFLEPLTISLPVETAYAEKRGFADFTGDGIEDMVEIKDDAWFGQKWEGKIFPGYRGEDGILHFQSPYKVQFPVSLNWFSSQTKLDTADVNGDGYAEVVMTQYTQRIGKNDTFDIAFLINQGNGKTFRYASSVLTGNAPLDLAVLLQSISSGLNGEVSNFDFDQYIKMDWSDMDGDKKDDFSLFFDDNHWKEDNLVVTTWYSRTIRGEMEKIVLDNWITTTVPGFTSKLAISGLDTADYTGDGLADISIYFPHMSNTVTIAIAENKDNGIKFTPHKDSTIRETDMSFFSFEKRDSLDMNFDGCADYVYVGKKDGKHAISYNLGVCHHSHGKVEVER